MTQSLFFDELMQELGNQTSAKLGHNIFKGNSFGAVVARAMATSGVQEGIRSYGKNPKGFGHNYENQQVGELNAEFAYENSKNHALTTDTIAEIVQGVCAKEVIKNLGTNASVDEIKNHLNKKGLNGDAFVSNYLNPDALKNNTIAKKLEALSTKNNNLYTNYSEKEMLKIAKNKDLVNYKFNDTQNDIIIINENGKVIEGYQLKATTASVYDEQFKKYEKLMVDSSTYERWVSEKEKLKNEINSDDFYKKPEDVQKKIKEQFKIAKAMVGDDGIEGKVVCAGHKVDAGYTNLSATRLDEIKVSKENLTTLKKANSLKLSKSEYKTYLNECDNIINNSNNEDEINIAKQTKKILENKSKTAVLVVDKIINIEKRELNKDTLKYLQDNLKEGVISKEVKTAYIKECNEKIDEIKEKLELDKNNDKLKKELQKYKDIKNAVLSNTDSNTALNTTIKEQIKESGTHIAKTTLSDITIMVLSNLSAEIVKECKDEFYYNHHEDLKIRVNRILKSCQQVMIDSGIKGSSYGAIDVAISIASQFCTQIGGQIVYCWSKIRDGFKIVYNSIIDFITGKIKSVKEVLRNSLKAIFAMIMAMYSAMLDTQLTAALTPIFGAFSSTIASIISILICAFSVVVFARSLDMAINAFSIICAKAEMAKARREEIEALYQEIMPKMIENRLHLESFANECISNLKDISELSFAEISSAMANNDYSKADEALIKLASAYRVNDLFVSQKEFDDFMLSDEPLRL